MHESFARWLEGRDQGDDLAGAHLERAALDSGPGPERDARSRDASTMLGRANHGLFWRSTTPRQRTCSSARPHSSIEKTHSDSSLSALSVIHSRDSARTTGRSICSQASLSVPELLRTVVSSCARMSGLPLRTFPARRQSHDGGSSLRSFAMISILSSRRFFRPFRPVRRSNSSWHIEAIAFQLARVLQGETKRLIITVPPRSLKSICASVEFPAFILGHDPQRKIICVSYSEALARKHANDCRALMWSNCTGASFRERKSARARTLNWNSPVRSEAIAWRHPSAGHSPAAAEFHRHEIP